MNLSSRPNKSGPANSDVSAFCEECDADQRPHTPSLRAEVACDDELLNYCQQCWEREFGWA
jgi:hypothetical protein